MGKGNKEDQTLHKEDATKGKIKDERHVKKYKGGTDTRRTVKLMGPHG